MKVKKKSIKLDFINYISTNNYQPSIINELIILYKFRVYEIVKGKKKKTQNKTKGQYALLPPSLYRGVCKMKEALG